MLHTAYHRNGSKYEEFQHGCGCRTRKLCRLAARKGRGRGPPYRSRRRSRLGVRNCSRWFLHPRLPTPRKGSRRHLRGIGASMPFSVEYSLAETAVFFSTRVARLIRSAMHAFGGAPNFSHGDISLVHNINFSTDSSSLRRGSKPRISSHCESHFFISP